MRYWPVPSLTAARTFSMSAGLLASTVTPGRMAPDVSLTVPAMTACATAVVGSSAKQTQTARDPTKLRIWHLHVSVDDVPREWRQTYSFAGRRSTEAAVGSSQTWTCGCRQAPVRN